MHLTIILLSAFLLIFKRNDILNEKVKGLNHDKLGSNRLAKNCNALVIIYCKK